ncbi:hypothetical protein PpBr36_02385 [Pyricularia pennisetigena]|uniref:hypothetical protein n=1 Tax=Pyricularia pennisetigena TaxID=1578925 RepID=UPI00115438FF|nr:hypothetical protein PpBr36_02385 [Pyricularia pennisetigena]TLS30573.1 hypothetical protein PpBr36_02385 [Pyricularia pennisetigena]
MAATLRQLARPALSAPSKHLAAPAITSGLHDKQHHKHRFLPAASRATFFNLPGNPLGPPAPAHLTARRRLPYQASALYDIIADVDSYASFLPYCTHSRVTAWRPGPDGKQRWPAAGELTVGWGPVTETYTSRLYCIPGRVVEAVSGKGTPGISPAEAKEYAIDLDEVIPGTKASVGGLFESLVTRWTVTQEEGISGSRPWADVELSIRYQFANPMYQVATASVANEVAGVMVNAFEKRAKDLLGPDRR